MVLFIYLDFDNNREEQTPMTVEINRSVAETFI